MCVCLHVCVFVCFCVIVVMLEWLGDFVVARFSLEKKKSAKLQKNQRYYDRDSNTYKPSFNLPKITEIAGGSQIMQNNK